jgi:16S rRNA (guanine(966)-N(2))-methyltransferase RsmD
MRVIAGRARGRKLTAVPGPSVRPTADRVKEAVFSMLESRFGLHEARVLDLYAGSGALGIEALSRGAAAVVFVDRHAAAAAVVRRNLAACGFTARLLAMPAQKALARLEDEQAGFDGVFLDPPYASDEAAESLARLGRGALLAPGAWVVVEHAAGTPVPERCGVLGLILTKGYGNTHVAVYRRGE